MKSRVLHVERFHIRTKTNYETVLREIRSAIGRPELARVTQELARTQSDHDLENLLQETLKSTVLMEFSRLHVDPPANLGPSIKGYRLLRLTVGSPLLMQELTRLLSVSGCFAPITLLIYEQDSWVHLVYDKIASVLSECAQEAVVPLAAKTIDDKVTHLLSQAARGRLDESFEV